jgi:hypothetical protein
MCLDVLIGMRDKERKEEKKKMKMRRREKGR